MKNAIDDRRLVSDDDIRSQRWRQAKSIVGEVLKRRSRGDPVPDLQILATHPELYEELKRELGLADQIRQALSSARGAGPAAEPLPLLTDSEIYEQIPPPADSDPQHDQEIRPRIPGYFLLEEISRGGQATVYKAIQESTHRIVAIKVVAGGPFVGSRHRARFEREAQILAAFDHPNIVSIIERGRTPDGSFFFVMQYVDGLSLDQYWSEQIAADVEGTRRTIQLFIEIASAVEAAHERGVVHRDLKPSNIRVDRRGRPHVLDFGLARSTGEDEGLPTQTLTLPGQIVGSLPWASPEQAAGFSAEVGVRSDVYSIGVILYQSLTGQFPYSSDGPIDQILLRIRTAQAPPPSKQNGVRAGVDQKLDSIVLKALAKSPEDRYESAGKLAMDLQAWLSGSPTLAVRPKPSRRRVLHVAVGVLVACFAATAVRWKVTQAIQPPTVFSLPVIRTNNGIRLVRIPGGNFWFGSPDTEAGHNPNENYRLVSVKDPFFISVSVVTQDQYKQVMSKNLSDPQWGGSDMPVQNVSWNDAMEFCRRLGQKEHRDFRLPTEIEWEYACRAGSTDAFNGVSSPDQMGWYKENSRGAIHPVMQKWPNAWGLYDMHGNVGQWCADGYFPDRNAGIAEVAIRGGSALTPMLQCRSASRSTARPAEHFPDIGFRVVCNP